MEARINRGVYFTTEVKIKTEKEVRRGFIDEDLLIDVGGDYGYEVYFLSDEGTVKGIEYHKQSDVFIS